MGQIIGVKLFFLVDRPGRKGEIKTHFTPLYCAPEYLMVEIQDV